MTNFNKVASYESCSVMRLEVSCFMLSTALSTESKSGEGKKINENERIEDVTFFLHRKVTLKLVSSES